MTVRVGVLGVAGMGLYHLITLPRLDGCEVAAICDTWPKALDNASGLAPDAKCLSDPGELFSPGAVDAVVIATPNAMHAQHVRSALEAGLHVYCEKPLGITVGECREVTDLAAERGLRLQVGFQHRFQPNYQAAKDLADEGGLGTLRRAGLTSTDWFRLDAYFAKRPWRSRWQSAGGGVLMNQAIHHLDAFCWMAGMPSRVLAKARSTREAVEVEDDVQAFLEFPDGGRGFLAASTIDPAGRSRIELGGETATLVAEGDELRVGRTGMPVSAIMREQAGEFAEAGVEWEVAVAPAEGMNADTVFDQCVVDSHRDFLRAIATSSDPLNNGREATRAVELANALYLSAVTGEEVDLPLDTNRYQETFEKLCAGELRLQD